MDGDEISGTLVRVGWNKNCIWRFIWSILEKIRSRLVSGL